MIEPSKEDIRIANIVAEWYKQNYWLFKTDEIYGINIENDLFHLIKSCNKSRSYQFMI